MNDDLLILLAEAPESEDDADTPPTDDSTEEEDTPDAEDDDPAAREAPDNPPDTEADAEVSDPDSEEEDDTDTGDDDLDGDETQEGTQEEGPDEVTLQLQRERLYDAVVEVQELCESLKKSGTSIMERSNDDAAKKMISRAMEIVDEADGQCDVIRAKFQDLGYERVRAIYSTVRERVAAVAEILKHVIDGDDDFRNPDSGQTK